MPNLLNRKITGHQKAVNFLAQTIKQNNFPQSLLITGPVQIGKATLAQALAMTLNCQQTPAPCEVCSSCKKLASGNHPDIIIYNDAPNALKIEEIRQLQQNLSLRPHESAYKIAILCDFERATTSAANALLKTLEEPPRHVILILTAQSSYQLLPTISSRCQIINLNPVSRSEISQLLQTNYQADHEQAALLSHLALGRAGWAVNAMQNPDLVAQRQHELYDLGQLLKQNEADRLAYAHKLAYNHPDVVGLLSLWLIWWRDILLTKSGLSAEIANIDLADNLTAIASLLKSDIIAANIKQTQMALNNIKYNVNSRLNLEALVLGFPYLG